MEGVKAPLQFFSARFEKAFRGGGRASAVKVYDSENYIAGRRELKFPSTPTPIATMPQRHYVYWSTAGERRTLPYSLISVIDTDSFPRSCAILK